MAISRGDPVPEHCSSAGKLIDGFIMQPPRDNGSHHLTSNNHQKGKLLKTEHLSEVEFQFCSNPGIDDLRPADYLFGNPNSIIRAYLALRIPHLTPQCFLLGILNMQVNAHTGHTSQTWPFGSETIFYRGSVSYPTWRDPTDPLRGGSGYNGYHTWAMKQGNGGAHGGCSNFTGGCGTLDYNSIGNGRIMNTGSISEDGVIEGFPPNNSVTDLVQFTATLTGCCPEIVSGNEIISVYYYFCVYPEGSSPTTGFPGA